MHDTSRSEEKMFDELELLCVSPGYVHPLTFHCFRDNMVGFADALTLQDIQEMFSPDRLIRTEISTLFGPLVRSPKEFSNPSQDELERMVKRSDALLSEIHSSMSALLWEGLRESMASGEKPAVDLMSSGAAPRETIFYGTESAYSFQYRDIAPEKYGADFFVHAPGKGLYYRNCKTRCRLSRDARLTKTNPSCSAENWRVDEAVALPVRLHFQGQRNRRITFVGLEYSA